MENNPQTSSQLQLIQTIFHFTAHLWYFRRGDSLVFISFLLFDQVQRVYGKRKDRQSPSDTTFTNDFLRTMFKIV